MARTFEAQRRRLERQFANRLDAEHRALAQRIAALVVRSATARDVNGAPTIPNTRSGREAIKEAIWTQIIKPYYVGAGTDALRGGVPQSPYALLLVEGITAATRVQVLRQVALLRRVVRDRTVLDWLTGPRPLGSGVREMHVQELLQPTPATLGSLRGADGRVDTDRAQAALVRPRGLYDPFHAWVDPSGYRLNDRVWRTSIDVRSRVDRLLDFHISRGTSAVDLAALLEPFLTRQAIRQRTMTPYGTEGSYAARRLARTEITAAAHHATVNASIANPFVGGVQWRLSSSHPKIDICDSYARGGPNGDGIYPPNEVPGIPHPHCLCSQLPVTVGNADEILAGFRDDIRAARGNMLASAGARRARALQGILNPDYLVRAILGGTLEESLLAVMGETVS